jgi:hypothetical protein
MSPVPDSLVACLEYLAEIDEDQCASIAATIARDPLDPLPVYDLADTCRREGRVDLWQRAAEWARRLPHDSLKQLYRRGGMKLLGGDWSGWLDLESRICDPSAGYLDTEFVRHLRYETSSWNGREDIGGRTILVIADGSLGDFVQMMRYVPCVAREAGRVILSVRPEAARFAREVLGTMVTITLRGAKPTVPFDRYAWLMSLPALVGELVPPLPLPFKLTPSGGYGVCWVRDITDSRSESRSIAAEDLEPLLTHDNVRWVDMQIERGDPRSTPYRSLERPPTPLITLSDVANVMITLDGILTVDNAIAHLAGTLGMRTWLLLNAGADTRWGLAETTPWYPTIRIFRQRREGDWATLINALHATLDASPACRAE